MPNDYYSEAITALYEKNQLKVIVSKKDIIYIIPESVTDNREDKTISIRGTAMRRHHHQRVKIGEYQEFDEGYIELTLLYTGFVKTWIKNPNTIPEEYSWPISLYHDEDLETPPFYKNHRPVVE